MPPRSWTSSRARVVAGMLLVITFLSGALAGNAFERVRSARVEIRVRTHAGIPAAFDELALTREQRRQIEGILERGRPRTEAVMEEIFPRVRAVTDSVDAEIRVVLTEDQRRRLDARRAKSPAFIRKRRLIGRDSSESVRVDTVFRR